MDHPQFLFCTALAEVISVHVTGIVQFMAHGAGPEESGLRHRCRLCLLNPLLIGGGLPAAIRDPVESRSGGAIPFHNSHLERPNVTGFHTPEEIV